MRSPQSIFQICFVAVVLLAIACPSHAWLWRRRRGGCSAVHCAMSSWSSWSSCQNGIASRSRKIVTRQSCGGAHCSGSTTETKTCCLPVNCVLSSWSSWSYCQSGRASRSRGIATHQHCGGARCNGRTTESKTCCLPVNCALSSWSPWSSCQSGRASRSRRVATRQTCGGASCSGRTTESKTCCLPVNCVWKNWGAWSACPVSGGVQRRIRGKAIVESCGGACSGVSSGSKSCACTKRNCYWRPWSGWSACLSGQQTRSRTKKQDETCGGTCTGSYKETQSCYGSRCGVAKVVTSTIGFAFFGQPIIPAIAGGQTVIQPGKWPWTASIQQRGTNKHICGGTLIASRWIVTAAHCIEFSPIPADQMEIVLGGHDLSRPDVSIQRFPVSKMIKHPDFDYNFTANHLTIQHDIGLIQLTGSATFNTRVQPVCLATDRSGFTGCYLVGWGIQNETNHGSGTTLQEVSASVASIKECENALGPWTTPGGIMCVDPAALAKICPGDSGGPLVCKGAGSGQYVLTGVSSFATVGCTLTHGINTGVADAVRYTEWIRQQCLGCA